LTGDGAGGAVEVLSSELARRRRSVVQRGFHFSREAERKILGKRSDATLPMPAYACAKFCFLLAESGGSLEGAPEIFGFQKNAQAKRIYPPHQRKQGQKNPKKRINFKSLPLEREHVTVAC
jgi:hypothetical protein